MASERPRDHSRLPIRTHHVDAKENQWPSSIQTTLASRAQDRPKDKSFVRNGGQRHDQPTDAGEGGAGENNTTLELMHSHFRAEIEQSDELDDPLDVYVRYVNWITEAYSTAPQPLTVAAGSSHAPPFHHQQEKHHSNISRESGLFALLEKSIRAFKNEKQYKNDARYVRLNIMYIHMIKDPLPMFKFMMTNGIGSELSTFYEEYASFLEHAGDGRKALEIMRLGVEREARPLQRLKRKLEELYQRVQPTTESSEVSGSSSSRIGRIPDSQQYHQRHLSTTKSESVVKSSSFNGSVGTRTTSKISVYADPPAENASQVVEQGAEDRFPVIIGASGRKERLMVDLVGVYSDGEFQLDELRARLPRYNKPAPVLPEMPVRPPSRSLFGSNTSHVLSTRMTSSHENTLDFSVSIKNDRPAVLQDYLGDRHDRERTPPPPVRYPDESDLIPRTPPGQVRQAFGTTLVPRIELTPSESRKRSLSRNFVTSSPTLHSKSAYAEMNKIFSDRSRMSQGSVYWSDDYQEDNTITRTQFSEFGASSESEQDLEGGSTMTREIQAMKRQRANEAGDHTDIFDRRSSQMSVGSQSRTSTSDITRAIEARGGIVLSQESRSRPSLGKSIGGVEPSSRSSFSNAATEYVPPRSSLSSSTTAFPSLSWTKQPNSFTLAAAAAASSSSSSQPSAIKKKKFGPRMFEVFRDEQSQDTPDLAESSEVPALGDEEPPSQLDVQSEDDLRDLSWQAGEGSDLGEYLSSSQRYSLKRSNVEGHEASSSTAPLKSAAGSSVSTLGVSRQPFGSSSTMAAAAAAHARSSTSSSSSFSSVLWSVSAPFSGSKASKGSSMTTTPSFAAIGAAAASTLPQQPSPPRMQELQNLFSPSKSNPTLPTLTIKPPPPPSSSSTAPKSEDWPTRLSTSRLSGGKTLQMQRPMFPNPCFPGSQRIRSAILDRLMPGLKTYPGYHEDLEFIMEHHLRVERSAKRAERSSNNSRTSGSNSSSSSSSNNSSNGAAGARGYQLGWSSANTESEAIQLGQESFTIRMKVGEGGYAKVYGIQAKEGDDSRHQESDSSFFLLSSGSSKARSSFAAAASTKKPPVWTMQALKLERPGNPWEFYILSQIHKRFQASGLLRIRGSVIQPQSFYRFKDESYLIMEYCSHGTLLDAINVCRKRTTSGAMDESLALFFTIELLRVLEGLHAKGIVHGDLKADNCLSNTSTPNLVTAALQTPYEPNGGGSWSRCGLKLIDFGRAVDLTQFERDMEFRADWPVDAQDCPEIRAEQSWRFQPDYFGLAKIVFTMLTGLEDMPTGEVLASEMFGSSVSGGGGDSGHDAPRVLPVFDERRYRVSDKEPPRSFVFVVPNNSTTRRQRLDYTLRRYWKQELWRPLFDILLNPTLYRPADRPWEPCTAALAQVRAWMQQHLTRQRVDEPRGVRKLLSQLEVLLLEHQKTKPSAR
ncbi:hypothetical protein BGZ73_003558 [Actinomortierella ambigua]|nr:hypothetical protein BGZ73_003558 [Actinomortierella ambigua]